MVEDRRTNDRRVVGTVVVSEQRLGQRRRGQRRSHRRLQVELWIEEMSGESVHFRRSANVSEGGVFFTRAIPHALGTRVALCFALPGQAQHVVARGQVVSAPGEDGLGMGVKFTSIEGDGRERIRTLIG